MQDWRKLVRARLAGLALEDSEKDAVHAELTAHLEDRYQFLLQSGYPESEAVRQTLLQVENWKTLRWKIEKAKKKENLMNDRVRQFWLPALLTLFLFMASLMLIQLFGPDPVMIAKRNAWTFIAPVVVVYLPWILSLPLIGAIGAYLSSRAGASQRTMFLSVLSPTLPYTLTFVIGMPMILILNHRITHDILFSALFAGLVAWVIGPSLALLAGAWFAQTLMGRFDPRRAVTG